MVLMEKISIHGEHDSALNFLLYNAFLFEFKYLFCNRRALKSPNGLITPNLFSRKFFCFIRLDLLVHWGQTIKP